MNVKTRIHRAVVAATCAVTAFTGVTAFTAVTAPPAHANRQNCLFILLAGGYHLTDQRIHGCEQGSSGQAGPWFFCYNTLTSTGVRSDVADQACDAAAA